MDHWGAVVESQRRVVERLKALRTEPPQSLLLEGGTLAGREALGLYWAALLNCPADDPPCLSCSTCSQVGERVFMDLAYLDGAAESIKIDMVRELRPVWGQPPRGGGYRVTVINQAQELTVEAANALLKSLEEPRPGNVFCLLAPQREKLMETLVSRSWVATLSWPREPDLDDTAREWTEALVRFWQTGQGWFERTSVKGAVTRDLANGVLAGCRGELIRAMTGDAGHGLGKVAASPASMRKLDVALEASRQALEAQVNPALVLDWLATRMV